VCRHQLAIWNQLTGAGKSIDADIHSIAFNVKDRIAPIWLKDSDKAEVSRAWRRKVLELNQRNAEVGSGTGRAQRWTTSELTQYAIAQVRPIAEGFATSEEEINKFLAHVVSYKTLNPNGSSKRAKEACSKARDALPPPASLAPNADTGGLAGPSILNPQVPVKGGKQQSKRHKGPHEAPKAPKAKGEGKRPRPAAPAQ